VGKGGGSAGVMVHFGFLISAVRLPAREHSENDDYARIVIPAESNTPVSNT
jgi:hypothetical protein